MVNIFIILPINNVCNYSNLIRRRNVHKQSKYKSLTYTNYLVVLHLPICGPGDIKKFNTYSPFGSPKYVGKKEPKFTGSLFQT